MSCQRFKFLLAHLRLDDKALREEARGHDKFAAAREIFELFNEALNVLCPLEVTNILLLFFLTCKKSAKWHGTFTYL
jgi:hypothetical protein